MKRVLVTGGSGGLGQAVCAQLAAHDIEVTVYDLRPFPDPVARPSNVHWIRGDIRDQHHLPRVMKAERIETLVHLSAMLSAPTDLDPATSVEVNCGGMTNVLETARLLGGVKVVWSSSLAVFAGVPKGTVLSEDTGFAPTNIYGANKVLCEILARRYATAFDVDVVGLRCPFMLNFASLGVAADLARQLVTNPVRGVAGVVPGGDDRPNWLSVHDAARAMVLAIGADTPPGAVYNLSGDERSMREAISIMTQIVPRAQLSSTPGELGLRFTVDTEQTERDLDFRAQLSLEDQLATLADQVRATSAG